MQHLGLAALFLLAERTAGIEVEVLSTALIVITLSLRCEFFLRVRRVELSILSSQIASYVFINNSYGPLIHVFLFLVHEMRNETKEEKNSQVTFRTTATTAAPGHGRAIENFERGTANQIPEAIRLFMVMRRLLNVECAGWGYWGCVTRITY